MHNHHHLLIVDDEPDIRLLLGAYAEKNGYIPLLAENGEKAIEMLTQTPPDAIISDIMMPVMNGMELLREIKDQNYDIPVILMTAYGTIDKAVEAMKLGAADFITKPVNFDYLIQIVQRVFKQSELERKVREQERQLKADLRLASTVQRCMLPTNLDNDYLSLTLRYEPLIEIGGDYLATRRYSDAKIAIALYDVTGHGVSAALLATMLHHELTDSLADFRKPHDIIKKLNYFASEKFSVTGLFCTMVLILVDARNKQLTAINAGHPDILLWNKESNLYQRIQPHIPPIGLQTEKEFESHLTILPISHGDRIFLYTDGFIETRNSEGEHLGECGFAQIIQKWIDLPSRECIDRVFLDVANYRGEDSRDDLTLVIVDIK